MEEMRELKGIAELRRECEFRAGKPLRIYKAYPEIGRGGVDHDLQTHADVERMFARAVRPSFFARFLNFFQGWSVVPHVV